MPQLKGDIVVFSDASAILKSDALKKLVGNFTDETVGCVSGFYLPAQDSSLRGRGERLYWKYETLLKRRESMVSSILGAHGALYAIRRKLFELLEDNIINDDFILPMRIVQKGYRAIYETEAVAVEHGETSVTGELERRSRITVGNVQQTFLLKRFLNPFHGLVAFQFVSHKVLRVLNPLLLMMICLSSGLLVSNSIIFLTVFLLQVIFYFLGILGFILSKLKIKVGMLHVPLYFCLGTVSTIVGLYRSLTGKQIVTWKKVDH